MTESQIIEHFKNKEYDKAVRGLYSSLPAIRQYIKANSGTSVDAEDIFQDALVILHNKIQSGTLELTSTLRQYLNGIARNCWREELRRRKRLPISGQPFDVVETEYTGEERHGLAAAAFKLLGEKCREILILFYFKKKTMEEIAQTLGFADENVAKNQKYRCIQKAKENYSSLSKDIVHGK
ncbi:MAG: sigma-70 family RNA polymerase sigma factor [Chitinophagaceae bacterium]|nr:sigma-70 family RNA polymerase sigma factor [Chitinophagaceae bacterium]